MIIAANLLVAAGEGNLLVAAGEGNLLVAAGEGNLLVAAGEGTFGVLVLTGRPALRQMIMLETVSGTGAAIFYPASQALLRRRSAR